MCAGSIHLTVAEGKFIDYRVLKEEVGIFTSL